MTDSTAPARSTAEAAIDAWLCALAAGAPAARVAALRAAAVSITHAEMLAATAAIVESRLPAGRCPHCGAGLPGQSGGFH